MDEDEYMEQCEQEEEDKLLEADPPSEGY